MSTLRSPTPDETAVRNAMVDICQRISAHLDKDRIKKTSDCSDGFSFRLRSEPHMSNCIALDCYFGHQTFFSAAIRRFGPESLTFGIGGSGYRTEPMGLQCDLSFVIFEAMVELSAVNPDFVFDTVIPDLTVEYSSDYSGETIFFKGKFKQRLSSSLGEYKPQVAWLDMQVKESKSIEEKYDVKSIYA